MRSFLVSLILLLFIPVGAKAATLPPTPVAPYVELTWHAAIDQTDPAVAYNIYRRGTGSFSVIGNVPTLLYDDYAVLSPQTYDYYVTALDAQSVESVPSNTITLIIPFLPYAPQVGPLKAQ